MHRSRCAPHRCGVGGIELFHVRSPQAAAGEHRARWGPAPCAITLICGRVSSGGIFPLSRGGIPSEVVVHPINDLLPPFDWPISEATLTCRLRL